VFFVFLLTGVNLVLKLFFVFCVFFFFVFLVQCQCNRLSEEARLRNELLYIEWFVEHHSLTQDCDSFHPFLTANEHKHDMTYNVFGGTLNLALSIYHKHETVLKNVEETCFQLLMHQPCAVVGMLLRTFIERVDIIDSIQSDSEKNSPTRKWRYLRIGRIFLYQMFLVYSAYISSQVCLILLHLVNCCRSDAA